MRAWRLLHSRWASTALSGSGAALYPGRWNRAGERLVYLADSLALAILETRVHLDAVAATAPYVAVEVLIPDEVIEQVTNLPAGWQADLDLTRGLGSRWKESRASLGLRVPSAIVPVETNVLLNPDHPAISSAERLRQFDLTWDHRLL